MSTSYRSEQLKKQHKKLQELNQKLPVYVNEALRRGPGANCQVSSLVNYARDFHIFCEYLCANNPLLENTVPRDIPLSFMEKLTVDDIDEFLIYSRSYTTPKGIVKDTSPSRLHSLKSSLSVVFTWLCTHDYIPRNPTAGAMSIRIKKDKMINTLEMREVKKLVQTVETSALSTEQKVKRAKKSALRDTAIIRLFLNTGIRISELVGLNLDDIDFDECCIYVTRKGGKPDQVYFNDETAAALSDYIHLERGTYVTDDCADALFISAFHKRMAVRSVQEMIRKYSRETLPGKKKVTGHVFRKTYGSLLYEVSDLKNVQAVLGHESIATTSAYYINESKSRKKASGRKNIYSDT
jgi:site-specific recombinase XerD